MTTTGRLSILIAAVAATASAACDSVDDNRIPAMPVSINLGDAGMWNTYGVAGFGSSRRFILPLHEPSGYPYSASSATGFGGVLLICGFDPASGSADSPLAFDLSCPVEAKQDVRVEIRGDLYEAVCPVCGSTYDVTMNSGSPLSGPAASGKYALSRYSCLPTGKGGYIITN